MWGTELAILLAEGRGLTYYNPLLQWAGALERCSARSLESERRLGSPSALPMMREMDSAKVKLLARTMANPSAAGELEGQRGRPMES